MTQFLKLYRIRQLDIYENVLYSLLLNLCSVGNGYCQKSRCDLMNLFPTEISEGTLRRTISSLEKKGIIAVNRTGTFKNILRVLKQPEELVLMDNLGSHRSKSLDPTDPPTWISQIQDMDPTDPRHGSLRSKNLDLSDPPKKNILKDLIKRNFLNNFLKCEKEKNEKIFNPHINPPTEEMVVFVVNEIGLKNVKEVADDFLNFYQSIGWKSSKGVLIEDWISALKYWCSNARKKEQQANAQPKFFKRDCDKSLEEFAEDGKKAYKRMFGIDLDDNSQVIDVTNQSENNNNQIPASILNFLNHEQQQEKIK